MLFKRVFYFLIPLLLLDLTIFQSQAQNTTGKEFWLTFGDNTQNNYTQVDLQIRIVSGEKPTSITIHFTNLNSFITHNMGAYEVWTYSLDNTQKQAVYNIFTDVFTSKSIYIESSEPVSVYALNYTNPSHDATNILPITALSTEYYQISYGPYYDNYAVVATKNNTNVYHNTDHVATLDSGKVYYRFDNAEMTGAHITSDNQVAFFALNIGAMIPGPAGNVSHLMQQLAPVKTWGSSFFVPSTQFLNDRIRIVVSQDNTNIIQTGGTIINGTGGQPTLENLYAGQFVELTISDTGCYIKTNKSIGVCSFLPNMFPYPTQCWIPTIEQAVTKTLIAPFISISSITNHYALVCAPKDEKNNTMVSIGGASPSSLIGGSWIDNDSAKMSFYTMLLDNDTASYTFTNQAGLIVFGYGSGFNRSYYYLAGSAMRELDAMFYANDIHFQDLTDTAFCASIVNFRAEIENVGVDADSIKWYINGVKENLPHNQWEWNKIFTVGEYEIRMWVCFENNDTISKTGILKIKSCEVNTAFYANNVHYLYDTTFCAKNVTFRAEIEAFNATPNNLKWYINGNEYPLAQGQIQWSKDFETNEYVITMWARLENDDEIEISGTLKMEVFWVKIRNVRY